MNVLIRNFHHFARYISLTKQMGMAISVVFLFATAPLSYAEGSDVNVTVNGINVTATVEATSTIIRVGGPDGFIDEVRAEGSYVEWTRPNGLLDGIYRYEVYVLTGNEEDESEESQLHRESGQFEIRNGVPVTDVDLQREWRLADESLFPSAPTPKRRAVASFAPEWLNNMATTVLNESLDLLFSPAYAGNILITSSSPSIIFNDSVTFLSDWHIVVDVQAGQGGNLAIYDALGGGVTTSGNNHKVITMNGTNQSTANKDSIVIDGNGDIQFTDDVDMFIDDSSGNVGIGTVVPQEELHITSGDPTIRLDDVHGGIWEINSNGHSRTFDIRDITGGISPLTLMGDTGQVIFTGPFAVGSSRTIKHAFATVKPRDVLEDLLKLEVSEWSYNSEDASVRHMGPFAEDFGALFELGTDDKHVSPADMSGVAFAAIQGLHQIVQERDSQIEEMNRSHSKAIQSQSTLIEELTQSRDIQIETLTQSRDEMATRLEALEKLVSDLTASKEQRLVLND